MTISVKIYNKDHFKWKRMNRIKRVERIFAYFFFFARR